MIITPGQAELVEAIELGYTTVVQLCEKLGESHKEKMTSRIQVLKRKKVLDVADKVGKTWHYKKIAKSYSVDDGLLPDMVKAPHYEILEHVKSGHRKLAEIREAISDDRFDISSMLYRLTQRGLLTKTKKNGNVNYYDLSGKAYGLDTESGRARKVYVKHVTYEACELLIWRKAA